MKRCEVCGKPIRSGWKYCFEHRNAVSPEARTSKDKRRESEYNNFMFVIYAVGGLLGIIGVMLIIKGISILWGVLLVAAGAFLVYYQLKSIIKKSPERVILERKLREKARRQRLVEEVKRELAEEI